MLISCNGLPEPSKLISNQTKGVRLFCCFSGQGDGLPNTKSAMEREKRYPTKDFHIGKLIKAELTRQGRSITWLASQVNCSRENLYKVFRHKWIYTDLLFQICEALDFDFFQVCSEHYQAKKSERNGQIFDSNSPKDWDE